MKVTIIIPTYNEKENIVYLIPKIFSIFKSNSIDGYVLVVDDGSPDGTAEAVEKIMTKNKSVDIIKRSKKTGLGSAYKDGFDKVLNNIATGQENSTIIMEMDADFSHKPEEIPKFIRKIKEGYDCVIGSRYIPGGERKDPFYRRIFPIIGNFLYKTILRFPVRDTTAGYRAYRSSLLKKINYRELPNNFAFQAEIIYKLMSKKAKITEVPIEFMNRRAGVPKYGIVDLMGNGIVLLKLFFRRLLKLE